MSELQYKFIICSDVHSSLIVSQAGVLKSYQDSIRNGVAAVMCCGDIMEPYFGVSPTDRTGAAYTNGRAMIGEMARLGGIMCAGNHSSSYGYGTYNGQSGVEAWNTLYDESRIENDGMQYIDRYTRIKYIGTDAFIAVSDMTGGADYPASTVENVRAAIAEAKADNRRIFVLTHYPYCCLSDGSTRGQKNSNIEHNAFGARLTNATDNGTLRTQANYPDPRGNTMLEMLAHTDGLIWFSGHNHNFWQISHEGGLVLYSQTAYAQSGAAANTNYLLEYPYAHVLHLNGGAYMINLPSLKHNLQDAIVYVYDDHVEIRERQCTKGSTISASAVAGEVSGSNERGAYKTTAWTVSDLDDGGSVKFEELSGGTHSIPLIASSIPAPGTPDPPEPPSGGVLSVPIRLVRGGTITNYDELPPWVRERLENGEKLWYMSGGRRIEITWG